MLAIACGGEFNEQELRRAAGPSPLFLFHQAERLLAEELGVHQHQIAAAISLLDGGATVPFVAG